MRPTSRLTRLTCFWRPSHPLRHTRDPGDTRPSLPARPSPVAPSPASPSSVGPSSVGPTPARPSPVHLAAGPAGVSALPWPGRAGPGRWLPWLARAVIVTLMPLAWPTSASAVVTSCTASIDSFAFGSFSLTDPSSLNGTVNIYCNTHLIALTLTVTVKYCLSIGDGTGGAGPMLAPRWMKNAANDSLQLDLSHDASHVQNIGTVLTPARPPLTGTITYLSVLGLIGSGHASHTIHARVPAQPLAAVGNYSSNFAGSYTELTYRYRDILLSSAPSSCTSGGSGGESMVRAPFSASARVDPECRVESAGDMDFGTVPGVISSPVNASSSITMTCRRSTPWQMSLSDGQNASGAIRRMANPNGSRLAYELYRDAAMTQRFGQTEHVDRLVGTGTGTSQLVRVYGRINSPQSVPVGAYTDRVIVTVTY